MDAALESIRVLSKETARTRVGGASSGCKPVAAAMGRTSSRPGNLDGEDDRANGEFSRSKSAPGDRRVPWANGGAFSAREKVGFHDSIGRFHAHRRRDRPHGRFEFPRWRY